MRLIKRQNVIEDAKKFPQDIQQAVKAWCKVVKNSDWQDLEDIRKSYDRSVDKVEKFLIFNIKPYRLIVGFNFQAKIFYYKYLLTYDDRTYAKQNGSRGNS
ncbi:type II toxin-antitoxin system HigB family toxin [Anabaena sphaerica FACHB-251]|uniref:Type II toxin-antitoxin system HigB family toxin n=1 Tax=Anabaena sphaerica FACHB-251 TaxID=2692883 RepID=A0A926ZYI1_9NOST|nr:type II toxin-antitoxin system HigB family toxin [Anabaena sphaerica]MBD2292627.1 type II toxin-antitoxin system HigB family toxin [Anabaena sphaerica FACHB-251]